MDSSIEEAGPRAGGADETEPVAPAGPRASGAALPAQAGPVPSMAGAAGGPEPDAAAGGPVASGAGEADAGTGVGAGEAHAAISEAAPVPAAARAATGEAESGAVEEASGAGGDGAPVAGRVAVAPSSLSPSRAGDFMQCPLLYRFRVIDRLPEKPSEAATRGTLVHAVLERLFDAPAGERTVPRAKALIPGQWDRLRESRPEVTELFADDPEGERLARWLAEAERLVERWFSLEDPTRLEPAERELFVEAELESGLRLRGIIDRVDVAPTGEVRIVDYKTGKAPRAEYADGALFQMKFYALVVWRLKRVVPRRLQLVYLGSGDVLTYDPDLADLERVERKLHALWEAISQATRTGVWRPRPTKLCGWCDHQAHCPEFGGTPPPYPLPVVESGPGVG
ncbi:PD-(D/E)XK nuclease family protein [Streptomyces sp. NPDC096032]|uniref:RecB family exonuclease n=1 Tax=Streptomyces sp. NPDC096032 TaxID=3366070 RepID=UPI003819770D